MGENKKGKSFTTKFVFERQKNYGTAAMIFTPIGISSGAQILTKSIHLTVTPNRATILLYNNGNSDYVQSHDFPTGLIADGATEHECTMSISGNTITITVDNYTYSDVVPSPAVVDEYNGRYAVFEFFCTGDRNFVGMPEFTYLNVVDSANNSITDNFNRSNGVITTTPDGHVYSLYN